MRRRTPTPESPKVTEFSRQPPQQWRVPFRNGPKTASLCFACFFVTMSTPGFGDITSVSPMMQTLTGMPSVVGQFDLAILFTWLVSEIPANRSDIRLSPVDQKISLICALSSETPRKLRKGFAIPEPVKDAPSSIRRCPQERQLRRPTETRCHSHYQRGGFLNSIFRRLQPTRQALTQRYHTRQIDIKS